MYRPITVQSYRRQDVTHAGGRGYTRGTKGASGYTRHTRELLGPLLGPLALGFRPKPAYTRPRKPGPETESSIKQPKVHLSHSPANQKERRKGSVSSQLRLRPN